MYSRDIGLQIEKKCISSLLDTHHIPTHSQYQLCFFLHDANSVA